MIAGTGHEIYVKELNGELNQRYAVMHVGEAIRDIGSKEIIGYQANYVATAVVNAPVKFPRRCSPKARAKR